MALLYFFFVPSCHMSWVGGWLTSLSFLQNLDKISTVSSLIQKIQIFSLFLLTFSKYTFIQFQDNLYIFYKYSKFHIFIESQSRYMFLQMFFFQKLKYIWPYSQQIFDWVVLFITNLVISFLSDELHYCYHYCKVQYCKEPKIIITFPFKTIISILLI